jgi:outer membrane protein OmpA-like peptidoglycan-associated protein
MNLVAKLALALLLAIPIAARAEEGQDVEGAKDHPAVERFPGSTITHYLELEFETFPFSIADEDGKVKTKEVEGKLTRITYDLPKTASCTQVTRNYQNAFKDAGLTTHKGVAMPEDVVRWGGGKWVSAEGKGKNGGQLYVYYSCKFDGGDEAELTVVEGQAMAQKVHVDLDASAMQAQIEQTGHIALHGINFDTGKANIDDGSAKALEQIGELLSRNAGWRLRIEGHTDDVGRPKDNITLSQKRAEAVLDWLVKNAHVSADRLQAKGFGDSKPVESNATDEGKTRNRRVELVKI